MGFEYKLRAARASDAPEIVRLLDVAAEGVLTFIWSNVRNPMSAPYDFGARECQQANSWCSYSNVIVAEENSNVVGIMLSFPLPREVEDSDEPVYQHEILKPFYELEMLATGTYYVDSLAIKETHRGMGIGRKLLEAAETKALELGFDRLSLQVFEENTGAFRLYQELSFKEFSRYATVPHACYSRTGDILLLQKQIGG